MKQLITIFCLLFSVLSFSQTTDKAKEKKVADSIAAAKKADSLLQLEFVAFNDSLNQKTTALTISQWAYKKYTAENYDTFVTIINAFFDEKKNEWLINKRKKQ